MADKKTYKDKWVCPKCYKTNTTRRKITSQGKRVDSNCTHCGLKSTIKAGVVKE